MLDENCSQGKRHLMVFDPFFLMLLLLVAALGFVAFLFLPSIVEVVKPRDKGPRKILRTPLQRIMRHRFKFTTLSKPDSIDDATARQDLVDFLKEAGVKARRIGDHTVRIFANVVFPPSFQVWDNIVVDRALTVGDRCVFHGSVKANGNVSIGNLVVVKGNLISKGNVDIKDEAVIGGMVHSDGSVRLGEKVYIGLSVVADGDVELYENSEVRKNILTHGVIKVLKYPKFDLPSTLEDIEEKKSLKERFQTD